MHALLSDSLHTARDLVRTIDAKFNYCPLAASARQPSIGTQPQLSLQQQVASSIDAFTRGGLVSSIVGGVTSRLAFGSTIATTLGVGTLFNVASKVARFGASQLGSQGVIAKTARFSSQVLFRSAKTNDTSLLTTPPSPMTLLANRLEEYICQIDVQTAKLDEIARGHEAFEAMADVARGQTHRRAAVLHKSLEQVYLTAASSDPSVQDNSGLQSLFGANANGSPHMTLPGSYAATDVSRSTTPAFEREIESRGSTLRRRHFSRKQQHEQSDDDRAHNTDNDTDTPSMHNQHHRLFKYTREYARHQSRGSNHDTGYSSSMRESWTHDRSSPETGATTESASSSPTRSQAAPPRRTASPETEPASCHVLGNRTVPSRPSASETPPAASQAEMDASACFPPSQSVDNALGRFAKPDVRPNAAGLSSKVSPQPSASSLLSAVTPTSLASASSSASVVGWFSNTLLDSNPSVATAEPVVQMRDMALGDQEYMRTNEFGKSASIGSLREPSASSVYAMRMSIAEELTGAFVDMDAIVAGQNVPDAPPHSADANASVYRSASGSVGSVGFVSSEGSDAGNASDDEYTPGDSLLSSSSIISDAGTPITGPNPDVSEGRADGALVPKQSNPSPPLVLLTAHVHSDPDLASQANPFASEISPA
ncbi:hypothetical protein BC831DRAFT_462415 [Entophlyctis helioformis]|nr:hypothetical protein BC831DRAFT_462415 [Entophlyctis helioformis]